MSEITEEYASSPIGMQSRTDAAELPYHDGHPTDWEQNNPVEYGKRPDPTDDPFEFLRWRKQRSDEHKQRQSET